MAKASEQFRQSDVTTWGIVALVMGGIAVMSANVSAILPQGVLSSLHKTRIEGASVEQLRVQVSELRSQAISLKRDYDVLTARFTLGEEQGGEVLRRVGALEVSLPNLLERRPITAGVDRSTFTSGIGSDQALVYNADGGSVMIRQQPMAELPSVGAPQPLPAPLENLAPAPSTLPYGIAIGPAVAADEAEGTWRDLNVKLGPLLFGMAPVLAGESAGNDQRIIAGPINQLAEATALCTRLERISVACMPVPYTGTPLVY